MNLPNGGTHNPHGYVQSAPLASGEHKRAGSSAATPVIFQGAEGASSPQRDDAGLHMPIRVYAMLPLDTVNSESVFKAASARWFKQALTVLAASGVHGVAVDVWWGAVERLPGVYSWAGYQQLVQLVKEAGLKMQAVMSFHACGGNVGDTAHIGLPPWVLQCGEQDPDLFYTDKPRGGLGQRNKEYISIWSSEERLLYGRTAYECYEDFMVAFKEAFKEDLGSTVEELVIGTGPCGELRYPSYPERHGWRFPGIGEFQCYDRRALASLAAAASAAGHPEWGYGGPHDAGSYNSTPEDTGFFAFSGSWDTSYGRFFLSWYSDCLLRHGERLLKLANRAFAGVTGSGNGRTFSTALSERSSRGNTEAAASQISPSQSGVQPAGAATLPAAGADRMVLHPPPQPAAVPQGAGQAAGATSREQLQGMRAQEGSPTALQQPGSCAMSSHGSVQSSSNLCESLHSNTPTSGSTAPLVHEPGLTSSSSSNYLCDPGVDVVGVVRGGGVGKAGVANGERGSGQGRSWQPQPAVLAGEDVPSTPPVHDLAIAAADGPRAVAESVMVTAASSQRTQQQAPQHSSQAAPWLGLSQQPIPGIVLPTPGCLSVPPQLSYSGNGSLLSPSFNPGQSGSAGGLMSPSFHLHQNGSSGGLVSPTFQPAHSGMHSAPSMTLVASGSSNLPSNAASLCGSEGTPSQTLYSLLVGNSAASAPPPRASPRMHHSDQSGLQQPQHQLQLLEQLQERSRQAAGGPDVAKPLSRFMSCQTIALCGNGASSEQIGHRPAGSGPSLATLSHPQQNFCGLTVTAPNDGLTSSQPGTAANGPTGEQPGGSQGTGSTPVASPSTPTTTCGEHLAPPLSECSGPGNSPPTNAPMANQTPTVTANANALNDLNRSVGQLSISSTSISTETSLVVESESDARQQRYSMDAPSSQVRTHGSAPAAISTGVDDAQQQQQQAPRRPSSRPLNRHAVTLSLKIAGVHWWFRSRSHAAELTAGYYNTATHDGYAGLVELCARYGAALTLTCVEMCDGQHPAAASCSPEGLLKQVRALTARHGVPLSGENALPIFLGHGVDTVALERVVINTRAWYGPRAFTTAARQHAYLLALQQHSQVPHATLSMPLPHVSNSYTPPNQAQGSQQQQQASPNGIGQQQQHQGSCGSHASYPPYTAVGWGDAGTQQAYSLHGLPPSHGGVPNQAHDTLLGRSVSDTGQLLYFQQFQQTAGTGPKLNGGSQPSSHEPSMHGGHSVLGMLGGGDYGQAAAPAMRHTELRSSPQFPDLGHASSLLLDGGSAGGGGPGSGTALLGPARAASVGGASGMPLDLPGEQRGVAACGLRIDSYADIVEPLPAMRSFTFLRLGPELLLTGYQAPWIRFMTGMQQGGYAPC